MQVIFGILTRRGTNADAETLNQMASGFPGPINLERSSAFHIDRRVGLGRLSIGTKNLADVFEGQEGTAVADAKLYEAPSLKCPASADQSTQEAWFAQRIAEADWKGLAETEGDFAVAHWRNGCLTLVRDAIGVRPLYYAQTNLGLVFASLPEMLLRANLVTASPDRRQALNMLATQFADQSQTLIPGLLRLPPAHALIATEDGTKLHRYWSLKVQNPITENADYDACAQSLRNHVEAAVRRRVAGPDRVGGHISSGLDCSSIAVFASQAAAEENQPFHSYTFVARPRPGIRFPDERSFADAVVQSRPNIHNTKVMAPEPDRATMFRRPDTVAGTSATESEIVRSALRDDVNVILSGYGGDECVSFNGRGVLAEHFVRFRWIRLWQEIAIKSKQSGSHSAGIFVHDVLGYILPTKLHTKLIRALGGTPRSGASEVINSILKKSYNNRSGLRFGPDVRRNRLRLLSNGHVSYQLEQLARDGAEFGVRYTFPLLDKALLAYAIRLPAGFFLRNGVGRAIFRDAMEGVLPETVRHLYRKRMNFPDLMLFRAERKDLLAEELVELRSDPTIAGEFDLDLLEMYLSACPSSEEIIDALNKEADGGPPASLDALLSVALFDLIHFARVK